MHAAVVLALAGCSLLFPNEHSRIVTGPDGMRTFSPVLEVGGSPMLCAAFGLVDPVKGRLTGQMGAREPVWLETDDGRTLSVVWPAGFTARFEPGAALYRDSEARIAGEGEIVELSQTTWDSAMGTFDDPYMASGLVFNGCFPFVE